jgi:Na+/melibiose symporter-like transporter
MTRPALARRQLSMVRVDFAPDHEQPTTARVAIATVVAVLGSLLADAALVAIGKAVFPSTKGYEHYQFGDYAKLTVIGVIFACLAWPVVTRVSSAPRWLFSRLAVLVTLVLLLPDVALLVKGDPPKAVLVLVLMHLAIAFVTYFALVGIAAVKPRR